MKPSPTIVSKLKLKIAHLQSISTSTIIPLPVSVSASQLPSSPGSRSPTLKRIGTNRSTLTNPRENVILNQNQSHVRPVAERSVEEKRLLIRKQLVILLHAILCRRRDLSNIGREAATQPCNVPFCGLMKTVLAHLNSCKIGRGCMTTHCASSRQILIHWKYCVKEDCPVCVSIRRAVPTSLLSIFPNDLCRAEVRSRVERQIELGLDASQPHVVPELMESEE